MIIQCVYHNHRSQEITARGSNDHDHEPEVGKHLYITVNLPPTMDDSKAKTQKAFGIITVLDHKKYSAEWRSKMLPSFLLRSYRVQRLREETDENGQKVTIYETKEAFGGLFSRGVQLYVGSGLQEGFEAMAVGLKSRSEQIARSSQ